MSRWTLPLLLAAITLSAEYVQAQAPPQPVKIGPVTLTGNFRTRVETWDWFKDGTAENAYAFSGSLLRLSFGQQTRNFDWQAELAAPILLGLPDNAVAPGAQGQLGLGASYFVSNDRSRNAAMVFFRQGYLRLKGLGGNEAHSLRLGRFEFLDGAETTPKDATLAALKRDRIAHRLIGNFAFTHVWRSLDGAQYVYNKPNTNFTLLAARPTRGVFQVDGWGELDIGLFSVALTRPVVGKKSSGEWRLFAIQYHDWRSVLKTDNRSLLARRGDMGNIRITTAGGNYLHVFDSGAGKFDVLFWGALQTGTWGALDHRAGAVAVEGGYQPSIQALKPWIRAGYSYGSGDGNPNDDSHNTFFQILPTPRIYARFPFYNMMNNQDLFGELILRPHAKVTLRTDVHSLRLGNRNDLWYQGGGAFQPWTFGYVGRPSGGNRGLATLFDLSADIQVNAHSSVGMYFAQAQGKAVTSSTYPNGKHARFGYVEFAYRF
ncbi:MAG: hypothetical protein A3H28_06930 [Acidobacteria bacterium RIFCSPLOWO2_02_FULL_61_28]|nr:MAG: hypothetical protein A3H28_06930 [Acidobacteria bacterium RIFCSPLOWO2_02_FULL_61_28]